MKKTVAVLLACFMVCGIIFAGCGNNSGSSKASESSKDDSRDAPGVSDAPNAESDDGGEADNLNRLKMNSEGLIEIYTAEDLVAYRDFANNAMNEAHQKDMTANDCKTGFILMADIDLSSVGDWITIGEGAVVSGDSRSVGIIKDTVIDGNNHSISNLNSNGESCALFFWMSNVEVKNLTFKNCKLHTTERCTMIGRLVGDCTFTNITLEDSVEFISAKGSYAGGLVIEAEDTVFENCNSAATVQGYNKHFLVAHYDKYDKSVVFNNCNNTGSIN